MCAIITWNANPSRTVATSRCRRALVLLGDAQLSTEVVSTQNGPMPKALKSDSKDVEEFKKAAGLSGLSSQLPPRGTRPMSMKRFYACAPTAMPGLVVPYGALRSLGVVK